MTELQVLVVDIGGTHIKVSHTGSSTTEAFKSGAKMTPDKMVAGVLKAASDWRFDAVSVGFPGVVMHDRIVAEPHNLGDGWVGFDFAAAFGKPTKVVNDATMQALGSYDGGRMLFLGLGTGLGTTLIVDGVVAPMELSHLPYRRGTYEDYVGKRGLERHGKKKWRHYVEDVIERLRAALEPDYIVLGGGNATKLKALPDGVRLGSNALAIVGGERLWDKHAIAAAVTPVPEQRKAGNGHAGPLPH